MSRRRFYGEDFAYPEAHRTELPLLYRRTGHRLDMCDRDFTEFCHWCKDPIGLFELVRNVGQDLNDKATTVTRRLASRAAIPAFLVAWRVDRPDETQARIDTLNRELIDLCTRHPIASFRARQLYPRRSAWIDFTPHEWWQEGVLILHRSHYARCAAAHEAVARGNETAVAWQRLLDARNGSRLWTPDPALRLDFEVAR